jgi:peroxiredoxin
MRAFFITFCVCTIALTTGAVAMVLPQFTPAKAANVSGGRAPGSVERMDLVEAVASAKRPKVGAQMADFETKDEIGVDFQLHEQLDRPLLFGAFCTCSTCKETARVWSALVRKYPSQFRAAALVSLPKGDQLFDFHDSLRVKFPLVPDPDHRFSALFPGPGEGYEALGCPRAWVVGRDGKCKYVLPMGHAPDAKAMNSIRRALGLPAS